jgi:integrase
MPLTAIPPGKRKGNKHWLYRGRVAGKLREITTAFGPDTPPRVIREDKAKTERDIWTEYEASRVPRSGENTTFAQAARQYLNFKDPQAQNIPLRRKIDKLVSHLGDRKLADISAQDLVNLANEQCPHVALGSRNDAVIIPAAAVLHYAAKAGWCQWLKIPQFARRKPETRSVSDEVAETLINSQPVGSYERLFLLWIFRQGNRVTETLNVRWPKIDLPRRTVELWVQKRQEWRNKPLHDEVFEALAAIPLAGRDAFDGYLFPWRIRHEVYDKWLTKYCKKLGVRFTPHMARHTMGKQLNANGNGLRTIMEVMDHLDPRSSVRYQSVDEATVRHALAGLGRKR